MSITLYFSPMLGLFDLLHHFQAEMLGYQALNPSTGVILYSLPAHVYPLVNTTFFDVQRGQYKTWAIDVGVSPSTYDPPSIETYTKWSLQAYFLGFLAILLLHFLMIFIIDRIFVKCIPKNATMWQKFIHACHKSHIPLPFVNWHQDKGVCSDHVNRKREGQNEVLMTIAINLIFNMALLTPLIILCKLEVPQFVRMYVA